MRPLASTPAVVGDLSQREREFLERDKLDRPKRVAEAHKLATPLTEEDLAAVYRCREIDASSAERRNRQLADLVDVPSQDLRGVDSDGPGEVGLEPDTNDGRRPEKHLPSVLDQLWTGGLAPEVTLSSGVASIFGQVGELLKEFGAGDDDARHAGARQDQGDGYVISLTIRPRGCEQRKGFKGHGVLRWSRRVASLVVRPFTMTTHGERFEAGAR